MISTLTPVFVEFIPEVLEEDKIYISREYATAQHKCCCGCGQRVVTPLSETGWRLSEIGGKVSLYPSIGNWSFPCRSHYWIKNNAVLRSYNMSQREIDAGRRYDSVQKDRHFENKPAPDLLVETASSSPSPPQPRPLNSVQQLLKWLFG